MVVVEKIRAAAMPAGGPSRRRPSGTSLLAIVRSSAGAARASRHAADLRTAPFTGQPLAKPTTR